MLRTELQKRGWYLDKLGVERECLVITMAGVANGVLAVLDMDGSAVDVDPSNVYFVPQHATDD